MQKRKDYVMEANYGASLAEAAHGVRLGDAQALGEMYRLTLPGLKAFLAMRVPRDLVEDYAHDIFMALVKFVEAGSVRDHRCLPGILRTMALRYISEHRRNVELTPFDSDTLERYVPDRRVDLETGYHRRQQMEFAMATLKLLTDRQREILKRFYLDEQSQDQICKEMGLTETQFRLLKSRAKARFGELGRRRLHRLLSRAA